MASVKLGRTRRLGGRAWLAADVAGGAPGCEEERRPGTLRLLRRLAAPRAGRSAVVLVALVVSALLEGLGLSALLSALGLLLDGGRDAARAAAAAAPGPVRVVLEGLASLGVTPALGPLLLVVLGALAAKSALVFLANREVGYVGAAVATELREGVIRALLAARWTYFVGRPVGVLANTIATEATRASSAYLYGASMVAGLVQGAVYAAFVVLVSWRVGLVGVAATALFALLVNRLLWMSRRAGRSQTRALRALVGQLTDSLQSVKPLKVMGRERQAVAFLLGQTLRLGRALQRDVISREALRSLQEPAVAVLLAVALYLALAVWRLPPATTAVVLLVLARALMQLGTVQRHYQELVIAESAFWAIEATIRQAEAEREPPAGGVAPSLAQGVRFERVGFAYGDGDAPVLSDVSLEVPAGAMVAVIGASGAGKTTLIDLLAGLLEPRQGRILVDGVPLGALDRRAWRQAIGYVPQDTLLLHDTVGHNVTLGDPALRDEDAERALRAAGAWDFVAALPGGAATVVGERGSRLSGGQRQRLAIARALVHRPALLILDEATSALDAEAEAAVRGTLRALRGELTILAVTHRPALTDAADRVYRLQDGRAELVADRLSASPDRPDARGG